MNYGRALDNLNDGNGECCGEHVGWYGDEEEDFEVETEEDICRQSVHVGLLGKTFENGLTLREAIDAEIAALSGEQREPPTQNNRQ